MPEHSPDPWRPRFHLTAPAGLVNDPNGLVHWNGAHHVFFQWNPDGCAHENKGWGHVRSPDLVHWERLPAALAPTEAYEANGCYSGSAVVDGDDLILIYTGNVKNDRGERETHQCLARSIDGIRFEKLGPVITGPAPGYTAHFRDPKVWREGGAWWMVLGVQTDALAGTVLLLTSPDLRAWTPVGPILAPGRHGYMCECPDLFRLDGQDVLMFCEQREPEAAGATALSPNVAGAVVGRLDRMSGRFDHGAFRRLDHGRDFYAPQTWLAPDGRRLLLGWMGLPEQDGAPTVADGWMHCLTLPRELTLIDGRLHQRPARELTTLRGTPSRLDDLAIIGERRLDGLGGTSYELALRLDPRESSDLSLVLRAGAGEATVLSLDRESREIRLEGPGAGGRREALGHARAERPIERLAVFVDRSSIEVFVDGGEIVFSARIYPDPTAEGIQLHSEAGATITSLTHWPLGAAFESDDEARAANGATSREETR